MRKLDLSGKFVARVNKMEYEVILPSTLDECGIGEKEETAEAWHPDAAIEKSGDSRITTRFTRKFAYDGVCEYVKKFRCEKEDKRYFVKVERTRVLRLFVNGERAEEYVKGTLSTPYVFEVTDLLKEENEIVFEVNNLYEGIPKEAIKCSSAATNETQTNWLGMLGEIALYEEKNSFIKDIAVYPREKELDIKVVIDASKDTETKLWIKCEATEDIARKVSLKKGINELKFSHIKLKENSKLWDEYEGNLCMLSVESVLLEKKTASFGIRTFGDDKKGHLALNGHRIFLRSETNCCVFADTGHMPLEKSEWEKKLSLYKAYGINSVRFHSHCPPEGAFSAADEMGMILQVELSNWDPKNAFESDESYDYYKMEAEAILNAYANHPSFCMMTLGNELQCNESGLERLHVLLEHMQKTDSTRLYAIASNAFYGGRGADEYSDFYTSSNYYSDMIRATNAGMHGHLNNSYPNTKTDYSSVMKKIREKYKKPVFSFEVGQYEILPDFSEIEKFDKFLIPDNFSYVKDKVTEKDFSEKWEKWVEASGELSLISYREEVEACMRTEDMSGISLLGIQDFPGQGTALVGMINSHFEPKPYDFARPERFSVFFKAALPLVRMEKYTYTVNERVKFTVDFANYTKCDISGILTCTLETEKYECEVVCKKSSMTNLGEFSLPLNAIKKSGKYTLRVSIGEYTNEYPIWVYTDEEYESKAVICQTLEEARKHLNEGENVLLSPESTKEHFPNSIKANFSTDFWSVGTFSFQEGYMGLSIDNSHPVFNSFSTDTHSNWQWWALTNSYAMILPDEINPMFDVLDSYARLRKLGFMFEANVGKGKIIVCSMGLLEKREYPEVRAMIKSILQYMDSEAFSPKQELCIEEIEKTVK